MTPYGYCECGCGEKTTISPCNDRRHGHVKGKPNRYIRGHNCRSLRPPYRIEDRGYKTPCWIWQRATNKNGYGKAWLDGEQGIAHILYFRKFRGPIPSGLVLDHRCRIPLCVNPDHLEATTQLINVRRGMGARLDPTKIPEMWRRSAARETYEQIAAALGVTRGQVKNVLIGVAWRDVSEDYLGHAPIRPGKARHDRKLLDWQVGAIRRAYEEVGLTQQHLAKTFGVAPSTISRILRGQRYREVA